MKSPGTTGRELLASGLSQKETLALTRGEEGVLPLLAVGSKQSCPCIAGFASLGSSHSCGSRVFFHLARLRDKEKKGLKCRCALTH